MNNPFQEQLLKAGLVTKQQVQKAQKEKHQKNKQQRSKKNDHSVDENTRKVQQIAAKKAKQDRDLNQKKQDQARQKAVSAEINQLILQNLIERDPECDLAYRFEHQRKIKTIYVNNELKQQIARGKLGIARIDGRYELVPIDVAEKIRQRNSKRIIIIAIEPTLDENDPYADFQVPDDLTW